MRTSIPGPEASSSSLSWPSFLALGQVGDVYATSFVGYSNDEPVARPVTRPDPGRHAASFRDPHGHVFEADGGIFRAVEPIGEPHFQALVASGLYGELIAEGLLVRHDDLGVGHSPVLPACRILQPERIPVISYASEWTFSQLRGAALLTLDIQARALRRGMSLRDASSFNVQFIGVRPVFIDTLSFARAAEGLPWVAYRQFCEHFLAPLALIAAHGHAASALWFAGLDGVALRTASALLPNTSWLRPGLAIHVHLHARTIAREPVQTVRAEAARSTPGFGLRLVDSLRAAVQSLSLRGAKRSMWTDYRTNSTYTADDAAAKIDFVRECVERARPSRAIDLGANDGLHASVLAQCGVAVTAVDADALSCEAVFNGCARKWPDRINTARVDLANPTPSFGWAGVERSDLVTRYSCDFVLALALVHHLSITKQIPFSAIAAWFAALGRDLIVEYVPATDPMALRLRGARVDWFPDHTFSEEAFLQAFDSRFVVLRRSLALAGGRILFWMRRRPEAAC